MTVEADCVHGAQADDATTVICPRCHEQLQVHPPLVSVMSTAAGRGEPSYTNWTTDFMGCVACIMPCHNGDVCHSL